MKEALSFGDPFEQREKSKGTGVFFKARIRIDKFW